MKCRIWIIFFEIFFIDIFSADIELLEECLGIDVAARPEEKIASCLKTHVEHLSNETIAQFMKTHYVNLKLIDSGKNAWVRPELSAVEEELLPVTSAKSISKFIDEMAGNIHKNHFMGDVFLTASDADTEQFYQQVKKTKYHMPYLITYAMAIDNIVKAARANQELLTALYTIWEQSCEGINVFISSGLHTSLKHTFTKYCVKKAIAYLSSKTVNPRFGKYLLPMSILETGFRDFYKGNFKNAKTSLVLAGNVSSEQESESTESGPTKLTDDKKCIRLCPPFPEQWADLYTLWSIAAASKSIHFPFFVASLVTPNVSGYHSNPQEYMHNRVIALYATLNFVIHQNAGTSEKAPLIDWRNEPITVHLGKVSEKSAKHYKGLITYAEELFESTV